jgi:hypothetical protein
MLDDSFLRDSVGDTLGRFALGDGSVTEDGLIEAAAVSRTLDAKTAEEILDPRNWREAELFCTP